MTIPHHDLVRGRIAVLSEHVTACQLALGADDQVALTEGLDTIAGLILDTLNLVRPLPAPQRSRAR